MNYLIAHGIPQDRLSPVGYGETRPKVVTRKMAERHAFLHEGDTLTEAFILRLEDKELQEVCNAYNRRTEFKVLRTTYGLSLQGLPAKEESSQEGKVREESAKEEKAKEDTDL